MQENLKNNKVRKKIIKITKAMMKINKAMMMKISVNQGYQILSKRKMSKRNQYKDSLQNGKMKKRSKNYKRKRKVLNNNHKASTIAAKKMMV